MTSTRYATFTITSGENTSSITLDDRRFTNFPMETAITTKIDYTIVGTPYASGNLFDGRVAWTGAQFLLTKAEYLTMQGLIRRQEALRRSGGDYAVLFDNVLYPFVDPDTTRTRAIATGEATTNDDGTLSYFAQHRVAIIAFSVDLNGSYYTASMDWVELDLDPGEP